MKLGLWLSVVLGICSAPVALAAADTISTDRPDTVESSAVVGKGRFQIETSLAYERDNSGASRSRVRSTPTLLRLGVSEHWELRLETDGRLNASSENATGSSRERGWADFALGVKWHQQDGDEAQGRPAIAWLVHVDVDSGSVPFRGQGLRPSVRMVAEWELPKDFGFGLMPGFIIDRKPDGRRFVAGILAAVVSKPLTERLRGFVEIAASRWASAANGGKVLTFDTGLAYLLTRDMQIDLALARGLNSATPELAWTVGWSARF